MKSYKKLEKINNGLGELNEKEIDLIFYIRNRFKFGDIIIQTRKGLPYRILKVTEYQTLGE